MRRLVLLIQLPVPPPGPERVQGNVPLAAGAMKLFARRRGLEEHFRIELLPPALADVLGDQGLVEEILGREPWMVGFTCYLWNIERHALGHQPAQRAAARPAGARWADRKSRPTTAGCWIARRSTMPSSARASRRSPNSWTACAAGPNRSPRLPVCGPRPPRAAARAGLDGRLDAVSSPYVEGILDVAEERSDAVGNGARLPLPLQLLLLS